VVKQRIYAKELKWSDWRIADGSVWYSMPQGDLDLYDVTYDGDVTGSDVTAGWLSGGLGQLADGEEGQPNFRLDPRGLGVKGYQWVGWRNDSFAVERRQGERQSSSTAAVVEMTWKFDAVRNFSTVRIHANNMFTRDVRVFRAATASFSVAGHRFTAPPVEYRCDCIIIGPIPWGHSGPLCHALSLSWTSMRRRRATVPVATPGEWA